MFFTGLQSMVLIAGNILLLILVLVAIKIFIPPKYIQQLAMLLWITTWAILMCIFINNQSWPAVLLKNIVFVIYIIGLMGLCLLLLVLRKFRRIYIAFYDFFLFLKSRIILTKKDYVYTFSALQLFETYVNFITKYIIFLEFIQAKEHPGQIKDRFLNFVLNFSTYGGVFCMFNEIFANEIYKFNSKTPNPKIIDCGSNIGLSILYFKSLYPQAEIIGFEPGPETFGLLKKNIEDNNLENVTVHNKALSDKEGHLTFYVCKENPAHGGWSVGGEKNVNYEKVEQQIPCTQLSNYITNPVDFLKIDIEGAEDLVIKDLGQNGKLGLIKSMILEYHHHMVDPNQDNLSVILKFLEDNNFGYQFNFIEKATKENKMRNTLILYAYNKKNI
jgi:FkbM family methyltransferase